MYYQVKVQFTNEEGKKSTKQYLVDAQSVTESEARTVDYLSKGGINDFEVIASAESKISEVITHA